MEDINLQRTIIKRLNTLISLMSDIASSENSTSTAQKIHRLSDLGLSPAEIGEILNKPTNYITATIHQKKKRSEK